MNNNDRVGCLPGGYFRGFRSAIAAGSILCAVFSSASSIATAAEADVGSGAIAEPVALADTPVAQPLRIVYFHSPTCEDCREVKLSLPAVARHWGSRIKIEPQSIEDMAVFNDLLKYEQHYGVQVNAPPVVFVGSQCLVGARSILSSLDDAIAKELSAGSVTFTAVRPEAASADEEPAADSILSRFEDFSVGAVAVAGLVDGVNPCAFTTIVFFLSMLAYLKRTRRETLAVGAGFTVGMFVAYFLLGLGLLGAVKTFSVSHGLSRGLACGVGILAFALAGWSLIDAIRYVRSGDTKQVTLGLPKKVKSRIHKVIRTGLTTRGLIIGSVSVGFLVSILESLCTGQVYLPTIVFMTRAPGTRAAAVAYLLLYNVMFIVPLLAILAMTYFGVRSETLGNMLHKRLALAKFAMAAVFAGLGVLVIATA